MRLFPALLYLVAGLWSGVAYSAKCDREDFTLSVSGESECLLMLRFGSEAPESLIVWLHGDVSSGGPANYHFATAERAASEFADQRVLSVALVRPGYPDGSGGSSSVAFTHEARTDHYTQENLIQVATAIERLKVRFQARRVIAVGHSGGAATVAVLLGLRPSLVDGAVLVACPCDLSAWRAGRGPWRRSENPSAWINKVDLSVKVSALTGSADDNTEPELARIYIEQLRARGIDASFKTIPFATHNSSFRSPEVLTAVRALLISK
jgi:pimeloyl-ACP methyl ester carboxylesterase